MKKMIIRLFFLFVPLMLFTSCTHKPYHPNKSEKEWTVDHEICEKSVRAAVRDEPYIYDDFDEMRLIKECMREKGWRWERTGLFNFKKEESK